jgi:hypothetical protein
MVGQNYTGAAERPRNPGHEGSVMVESHPRERAWFRPLRRRSFRFARSSSVRMHGRRTECLGERQATNGNLSKITLCC